MEILALILLGLIAMLAIVPPIIRGKLDESPLATTQSFHRSMEELGHSLEPHGYRAAREHEPGGTPSGDPARPRQASRRRPPGRYNYRTSRAAVRRNRIMAGLMVLAFLWGAATLISGSMWCLILFASACFLLVLYWSLAMLVPRLVVQSQPSPSERISDRRPEKAEEHRRRAL